MADRIKVQSINFYHFTLPLGRPFTSGDTLLSSRDGVIVHMLSREGEMGFGEVAPLPGLSPEPLKKALHQLRSLKAELTSMEFPLDASGLIDHLDRQLPSELLSSSVRFGIESAAVSLVARAARKCVFQYLGGKSPKQVITAALLHGTQKEVLTQAAAMRSKGFETYEVTVGNRNIPLEVQKIERLKDILGYRARLRINAMASWDLEEAVMFGRSIGKNQIEFIEEPCRDINEWENFFRKTDIPFAVGPSFSIRQCERLEKMRGLSAVVFRPTISGGITGFCRAHKEARERSCRLILGACLESGVGLTILANLAALTDEPAAFGAYAWLDHDLLAEPLIRHGGAVLPVSLTLLPEMFHEEFKKQLRIV